MDKSSLRWARRDWASRACSTNSRRLVGGGCLVLETFSVSHGKASAYLPVIELLKDYFKITAEDDERRRQEKIPGKS